MDMQEILSQVITSTNEIFEAEAGSVALLDSSGQNIVIRAAVGAGADAVRGLSLPVKQGVIGWVALHEKPALIPDVTKDNRFFADIDSNSGFHTKSILCVPMKADGNTIGVIELMNMHPNYLSEDGTKILTVIADHAALAIENARLFAQTRQQSEEQALLFEAMAIVTSDLALDTVLDAVSRQMVEALKSDLCIISRWDRDANQLLTMQSYAGPGIQRPEQTIRPLNSASPPEAVLKSQKSTVLEISHPDNAPERIAWLKSLNMQALFLIPLIYRRQTIGLVEIGRRTATESITPGDLRLAETMAAQAAVAIEHARFYNETTRHLAEAKVLQEVMVAAASQLDFNQVLNGTIEALHRTLGIERLGFFLPSNNNTEMIAYSASTVGFAHKNGQTIRVPVEGSVVGWVNRNGKPLLIPDVRKSDNYYNLADDTHSELCVPVILNNQVVAVLNAESPRLNAFGKEDLRLFSAIAAELSVALNNAQLFQTEHRLVSQQKALLDVFVDISSELQPEVLFQRIIERAIEVIPNADAGSLVVPKGDVFVFAATVGFDIEKLHGISFTATSLLANPDGTITKHTSSPKVDRFTQDTLLKINKSHLSQQFEQFVEVGRLNEIKATLRAVLFIGDELLGAINVDSLSTADAFNEEDEQTLLLFASQAAIAIQNARLFEEIRTAEARYRDLFDNANDFIFTLDANFRISSANKVVLKSTGYQLDEIIGMHFTKFVLPGHTTKIFRSLKAQLASKEAPATFEMPVISKDKQEKLLEITMRVQRAGRRPVGIHCIARDITKRRELEQQLRQTEKLSTIGKLVAGVAHELNNPLTSIIGYASLLQESNLPSDYQEDLQIIFRQAERARIIVQDLLTFARRINLETEPVDVNEVIQTSLALMKPHLQNHNIQVTVSLDFGLSQTIADPHQLEQVFVNLITNAVQALSTVPRTGQLKLETKQLSNYILISLADNGPGIPENIINRVFDPFFSTKDVGDGTGLGLSICFGIISEHKGRIWAENNTSHGVTFYIELPLVPVESPTQTPDLLSTETFAENLPLPDQLQILAIDDEPYLLTLLQRVLTKLGHTVDSAPNAKIALQKIAKKEYDIVICDVLMPDILGPDLYSQVIEKYPQLASSFIFITGNVVDIDTRIFLETTKLPWLPKPFLPADIEKIIGETWAKNKQPA